MNTRTVSVSIITSDRRLSKGFSLAGEGLVREQGGAMVSGTVQRRDMDLSAIPALIQSLTPAQAMVLGAPRDRDEAIITTKAISESGNAPAGAITRTNADFGWTEGAALLLLDYDPQTGTEPLSREELWAELVKCVPELDSVPCVQSDSASSHIYLGDECLKGASGLHFFIPVVHGDEIPALGAGIARRLRDAGHVYDVRSKSGASLKRTLVDTIVWQQSRLSFDAGAACSSGLVQRRPAPALINPNGDFLSLAALGIDPVDPEPTDPNSPNGVGRRAIRRSDGSVVRFVKNTEPAPAVSLDTDTVDLLRDALNAIPADGFEQWITVGLALSSCDQGYELWKNWSLTTANADSEKSLRNRWRNLRTDGSLDYKSVLRIAMRTGWGWDKADELTKAGMNPHKLREHKADYVKPWRPTDQQAQQVDAVHVEDAREDLRTGLQRMVQSYLEWYGKSKNDRGPSAPWLFSPTMGVGKTTALKKLTMNIEIRLSGARIVIGVPNHAQALEYERDGWFQEWGRQEKIDETCESATQKDALCQNYVAMMLAVEKGHVPQSEFCRTCANGLAWAINEAERRIDQEDISDETAKKFHDRIAGHRATLHSRGLDPEKVEPCKWQGHLRESLDQQFVIMVSQSYSHSVVGNALYISDERFAVGKPVQITLQDVDQWARRNGAAVAKMEDMESLDAEGMERLELFKKSQRFFQWLARDLAKWIGQTGSVSIDPDLLDAVGGLLKIAKARSGGNGVAVAGWEALSFAADGTLDEAPLRAAFAIAETLEGGDGYVADGALHVSASTAVMERIAMGLPVCVMDATPDPVIVSAVKAHAGRVVHAIARQAVRITRRPSRFWGLKALNIKLVGQVRVDKEVARYRAAIAYHEAEHSADAVAFLMHKRAFDLLYPDPQTAPANCGYWGRDHRAHNNWSGRNLVIFGSFFPPPDAWRAEYQSSRIGAIAAGCDPQDWPIWSDDMENVKETWLREGDHEVKSTLPMPADPHIRQWLLSRITSECVQAIGRVRGANLAEPVTVTIYGGVPLCGLGGYGLAVSEYLRDHESLGVVKAQAEAESQTAAMAALDAAAMQAIRDGKNITHANLKTILKEGKNSFCHQGRGSTSLLAETPAAPHERIYAQWFALRAPELARHMSANGRQASFVKLAREYALQEGIEALAQAVGLANSLWNGYGDVQYLETLALDTLECERSADVELVIASVMLDAMSSG